MRQEATIVNFTGKLNLEHYASESTNYTFTSNLIQKLSQNYDSTNSTFLFALLQ